MLERSQESATNPETYPQLLNKVTESELYLLITPDLVSPQKKGEGDGSSNKLDGSTYSLIGVLELIELKPI